MNEKYLDAEISFAHLVQVDVEGRDPIVLSPELLIESLFDFGSEKSEEIELQETLIKELAELAIERDAQTRTYKRALAKVGELAEIALAAFNAEPFGEGSMEGDTPQRRLYDFLDAHEWAENANITAIAKAEARECE